MRPSVAAPERPERSRAGRLPVEARLVYSGFALFTLGGLASSIALYDTFIHFDARSTPAELFARLVAHYHAPSAAASGAVALTGRALLETTHAHLFTMPVALVAAAHLFFLTGAGTGARRAIVVVAALAMGSHLAAPYLTSALGGAGGAALVYPVSGALLLVALAVMLVVPLVEMWLPPGDAVSDP